MSRISVVQDIIDGAMRGPLLGEDVRQLSTILTADGAQSAVAQSLAKALWRASVLISVANTASQSLSLDVLIPQLIRALTTALGADRGSLFLSDPKHDELFARVEIDGEVREIRIPAAAGIAGHVFKSDQPLIVPDAYDDPRFMPEVDLKTGYRTRDILCAPIRTPEGSPVGVVQLLNRQDGTFSEADRDLLVAALTQVAMPLENARLLEALNAQRAARERIEGEMAAARDIQKAMLPQSLPRHPEFSLHALIEPARAVGGDLYDYFVTGDGALFFLIGDVSDKGVPASIFMAMTKTLFRAHAQRDACVARVVEAVNRELCRDNLADMFVTAFCGLLRPETGELQFCDGGHEPPFLLRSAGGSELLPKNGGLALSVRDDWLYTAQSIRLEPGDGLVLYTDGVTEATNAEGALYSREQMGRVLATLPTDASPAAITQRLSADINAFVGDAEQSDDIAMLVIRYNGPAA